MADAFLNIHLNTVHTHANRIGDVGHMITQKGHKAIEANIFTADKAGDYSHWQQAVGKLYDHLNEIAQKVVNHGNYTAQLAQKLHGTANILRSSDAEIQISTQHTN